MIRVIIPATGNEFITLFKLTSLASVISLRELLTVTSQTGGRELPLRRALCARPPSGTWPSSASSSCCRRSWSAGTSGRRRGAVRAMPTSRARGGQPMSAPTTMIAASEITKRYGRLEVLQGVSLAVERGQVKVIVGPSGSGKSTLLRCLALLEPIDAGRSCSTARTSPGGARGGRGERRWRCTARSSAWSSSTSTSSRI